ncbi:MULTISPECIES: dTDP-4-dehydrorhamnose 3,5-epimerase [Thalassospira]|uniref:dTDP-4-dehydrorhamnose 3,5-epimerase n=4 Tax=Thalassospira TaxID=168934 RepID=A0A853KZN4_9PROT|nr:MULTISPECIES: dTDP-4-dehydrorhamnose 3,5-epimerase [Thalassospira]MBO6580182.1 dTDP-4-dehydrorhamnose 3,5-epimerase [Thalassospira sp.]MBO6803681.1 dTDP-4-dehydrorhamnose 3,5-epimerase [Thalassospira sp.]MBO6818934.1 dTDP-4-dehydrorhamnose 3,5-epimerase [Thalassospira sp.]NJB74760.1 dTDP-4-dehydrorhamnose 3,5-epimerase [Thalassospira tepidiphila]OAZ10167.1 dTDP-4-dehydrorhamnose 3,5-epimerase [Thalassospira tepidiphila MCCC 1A03514]
MKFVATDIKGVDLIELEKHSDDRGFFARSFCKQELASNGHEFDIDQANLSFNHHAGTLRGMHYQAVPVGDPKIVRCISGAIFDVVIDLRPSSPTYCKWVGAKLSAANRNSLIIPAGCAHGFMTLEPNTEVLYLMGAPFVPDLASGVRWNDPTFDIEWPEKPAIINDRDANYPDYEPSK